MCLVRLRDFYLSFIVIILAQSYSIYLSQFLSSFINLSIFLVLCSSQKKSPLNTPPHSPRHYINEVQSPSPIPPTLIPPIFLFFLFPLPLLLSILLTITKNSAPFNSPKPPPFSSVLQNLPSWLIPPALNPPLLYPSFLS